MLKLYLLKLALEVAEVLFINKCYPQEICDSLFKNAPVSSFHPFQRRAQNPVKHLRLSFLLFTVVFLSFF